MIPFIYIVQNRQMYGPSRRAVVSGWGKGYVVYLCRDESVLQLTVVMIAQPVNTLKTNKS